MFHALLSGIALLELEDSLSRWLTHMSGTLVLVGCPSPYGFPHRECTYPLSIMLRFQEKTIKRKEPGKSCVTFMT